MDISKQWMLGRCASVGGNFLFADALGPKWPSWALVYPLTARYFSDKQSRIQGQHPPHVSPQTRANTGQHAF